MTTRVLVLGLASFLTVSGCAVEEEAVPPVDRAIADAKPEHRFTMSAVDVPDEREENDALGFDHLAVRARVKRDPR